MKANAVDGSVKTRVWDLPTRLFHWALVLLLAGAWWSAENGRLDLHRLAGYGILTLLMFRIIWGLVGSSTARFASFVGGPAALAGYIRGAMFSRNAPAHAGHNPLGGWSVVAMIAVLVTQVALGLFAVDIDGLESGPFSYLVDFDTGRQAAEWHELVFNVIVAVTAIHVAAVLFYLLYKRDNLIGPMFSGTRNWIGRAPDLYFASWGKALFVFLLVSGTVWAVIAKFGQA